LGLRLWRQKKTKGDENTHTKKEPNKRSKKMSAKPGPVDGRHNNRKEKRSRPKLAPER